MIIKKTFLFSLLLASYFCLVGFRMNDETEIDITKIDAEIEAGSEIEIEVDSDNTIFVESENEYVAWASVENNKVIITGVSEGETIVKISNDPDFNDYISVKVTVTDLLSSISGNADAEEEETLTIIPMETNKMPEAIPNTFRIVQVSINGIEVVAWTNDYYYIFYGEIPTGEETWILFELDTGSFIKYDPSFMSGSSKFIDVKSDILRFVFKDYLYFAISLISGLL